jgi:hypothetical protein
MNKIKNISIFIVLVHGATILFGQNSDIKSMVDSLQFLETDTLDCKADLYWRIVSKGEQAIPFLIDKLDDTTRTNISFRCKVTKLNIGEVSYFALTEIASFPAFVITNLQFDLSEHGCWNFFGYLFDNSNKSEYKRMVKEWYSINQSKYRKVPLAKWQFSSCHRIYKIDSYLEWGD